MMTTWRFQMSQIISTTYSPAYYTGPRGIGMTVDLWGSLVLIFIASIKSRKGKEACFSHPPSPYIEMFGQLLSLTAASKYFLIERLSETDNRCGVRARRSPRSSLDQLLLSMLGFNEVRARGFYTNMIGVLHTGVSMRACPHQQCVHRQLLKHHRNLFTNLCHNGI